MSRAIVACLHLLLVAPAVARAAEDPVSIEVLDEGQATGRRRLRLSFVEGSRSKMKMTTKTVIAMRIDGNALPATDIPAVEIEQTSEIVDVNADGVARVEIQRRGTRIVPGPDTPPAAVQAMEQEMKDFGDIRGTLLISDRGIVLDATFEFAGAGELPPESKRMLDSMQETIQQLSGPFPSEPIGLGARWRTFMRGTVGGITSMTTTTYTVTELSADSVTLDLDIKQSAEAQDMKAPGLPADAVRLETASGVGGGTVKFASAVPFPVAARSRNKVDMQMTVRAWGPAQRVEQSLEVDLEMVGSPIDAAAPAGAGR